MGLINKLFGTSKIDCPRCLGKGEVSWDDIKRLKRELKWIPGKCAYCNGIGKVSPNIVSKVAVDNSYLTTDLSAEERKKLINQDGYALRRAHTYDNNVDAFIKGVIYLHFTCNLEANQIVHFYLIPDDGLDHPANYKKELLDYVNKIITHKNQN